LDLGYTPLSQMYSIEDIGEMIDVGGEIYM
jgi:hypothetical protein